MPDTVKLTANELDQSLSYIEAVGSSDFFPQPFEIAAIRHSWGKVRPILERIELLSYNPSDCYQMMAPKQRLLVRPVHLLDPIDTLLYTGLALRLALAIQPNRNNQYKRVVFSCHLQPGNIGSRETFVSYWDKYEKRVSDLCNIYKYVCTADIVDFFPRIYHHRLENALVALSSDKLSVKAIMRFIEKWSNGTSYGIPTGPHVSDFLAETVLYEVDEYLRSKRIKFVRWVDDYLFFSNNQHELVSGIYELGTRLHLSQGLCLNQYKTRLYMAEEYYNKVFINNPVRELRSRILDRVLGGDPYGRIVYDQLDEEEKEEVDKVNADNTLKQALDGDYVDLKTVKLILLFLSALRRPSLVEIVIDNLSRLLPVAKYIANFFDSIDEVQGFDHKNVGKRILKYINGRTYVPVYQIMWLLDPFTRSSNWNNVTALRCIARDGQDSMVKRQAILGLRNLTDRSSLLDLKFTLAERNVWEQRAIIYSCSKLPKDEFEAFINQLGGTGGDWLLANCLLKSVMTFAKSDISTPV
ncbi:MAG: RNA-directed DNA polymerase [Armatimonadota bacterium]